MHISLFFRAGFALALLCLVFLPFQVALASNTPVWSDTVMAGPYTIDIGLSQHPPSADQPFEVIVVAHNDVRRLSGQVIAEPGLGTDAVNLYAALKPVAGTQTMLEGSLHIPVRGAWQIVAQLDGPQGHGTGSVSITVAAPGAIPVWLAWLIGCIPLLSIAWWVWHQYAYRRRLIAVEKTS